MNTKVLVDALTRSIDNIVNFIPALINGLIVLVIGYAIAWVVRWLLATILRRVGFDPLVERTGITASLRGIGIQTALSAIIAQTVFILLMLSFLISATQLMGLTAVTQLLQSLLNFLPSIIAAVIIFLLGGIVAGFTGNLVAAVASGSGLSYAARLGQIVRVMVSLFVVVLALSALKVDTALLVTTITIGIAAFGLALGLALGLGARGVVHHVLAGYYLRQRFPVGRQVAIDAVQGAVSGIGGVNTLLTTEGGDAVVVPNGILLESLVRMPGGGNVDAPPSASETPAP
ncbi:MAG TPA: hypothetical protein VIJ28_12190 [Chloroflexota bacterium]|jgi:hypothetical protein